MMRRIVSMRGGWALMALAVVTGCTSCTSGRILVNGDILTMDPARPWADAVAMRDGRIVAVGTRDEVQRAVGSNFDVEDLEGHTVLPGFIDAHGHVFFTGMKRAGVEFASPTAGAVNGRDIDDPARAVEGALAYYASHGITTAQEAAISSPDVVKVFRRLARKDRLPIDVVGFPIYAIADQTLADFAADRQYRDHFRLGGVKLTLDGSLQAYTGYLSEPYHVQPRATESTPASGAAVQRGEGDDAAGADGESSATDAATMSAYRGHPAVDSQNTLDQWVDHAYGNGWPVLAHTNGDAATDMLLAAVRAAEQNHPGQDRRTVIVHAQTIREDQLDDARTLGMIPSFFASEVYYWGDRHRDIFLGPERAARISPVRSALDRGMPFTMHHDSPMAPADMMELVWTAATRKTSSGEELGADQRVPVIAALRAVTINAAYQLFEEETKGSIEPGKLADLVVLSGNPVELDPMTIKDIVVIETIKEGKTVYRRY